MNVKLNKIHSALETTVNYLTPLMDLANSHMVDFITKNIWEKNVPTELKQEFDHSTLENIFSAFRRSLESQDEYLDSPNFYKFFSKSRKISLPYIVDVTVSVNEIIEKFNEGNKNLSKVSVSEFMSSKKRHEVEAMSQVVGFLMSGCNVNRVIDIGSGKGYLSSLLALHYGLDVLGIDSSYANNCGAAKQFHKLSKAWESIVRKSNLKMSEIQFGEKASHTDNVEKAEYKQTTLYVKESVDLDTLVSEQFTLSDKFEKIGLVGLHTCGQLAPTSLRIFVNNPQVVSLCNVACCYHLINEKSDDSGFPLSNFLKSINFSLGRNARMLACQPLDRIIETNKFSYHFLYYRSLLELYLVEKFGKDFHVGQVGRLASKCKNFSDYVRFALKKLKIETEINEEELNDLFIKHNKDFQKLQVFYLIRVSMASVIETIILLDQVLYLLENNVSDAFIVQMFDPVISPRCYGVVAVK